MKKIGLILLSLVIATLLSSCSEQRGKTVISDETFEEMTEEMKTYDCGDYKCYMFNPGELEIIDYYGDDEELNLPSELLGMPVRKINCTFFHNTSLKTVVIPNSIQFIPENPFSRCDNLTNITVLPGNPRLEVKDGVLYTKKQKQIVCFPQGIKDNTFTIEQGTVSICESTFAYSHLSSITIPDSVEKIESYAFYQCEELLTITIPDKVKTIGTSAFSGSGLISVEIPNSVTHIGICAFRSCKNLKSIILPKSVTFIDKSAFPSSDDLTIYVPKDSYAESYCKDNGINYVYIDK